ncbi:hypothetical protein [Paraburkholderia unamae]|uniref:hypothetical protein n=1 Tax=Paraburkholderia unamae TaxID=219649 RepID=UPI001057904F|nr:hypothetical protein [Paraburkholderia unamae]
MGEGVASAAATTSVSDTSSSATTASQDAGTAAGTQTDADTAADLQSQLDTANAKIVDLEAQLTALKAGSDHPIHPILGQIEAELQRPGAVIVVEIKNLVNRARALF